MFSALRFVLTILLISIFSNIEGTILPIHKLVRNSRSIIAGGILPEGVGSYNNYNRLPQHNGAQQGYFNNPHLMNTNNYGQYPGGYYENHYYENPLRSAWEWLTDTLAYCFSYNGYNNNYYHSGYNRHQPMRGNSFGHGMLRSEDD